MGQILRHRAYRPPAWWRVWLLYAPALLIGIPAITMTVNWPVLPPVNAAECTVATLAALALLPGAWAAESPLDLAWLVLDGFGLAPALTLLRAVELPGRGLRVSVALAYGAAIASLLGGAGLAGDCNCATPVAAQARYF